ncbi:MAG TPA: hypothetical protein VFF09_03415 [archaeon]|nr:hypothetical protein [archaeon]
MVEVSRDGKGFRLVFTEQESSKLGFKPEKEYEMAQAINGIWVIVEGKEKASGAAAVAAKIDVVGQKIAGMLKQLPLKERVEGIFEKSLKPEEAKKFSEMLSKGKVEKFKLNEKYRKAVYRFMEEPETKFENNEKPFEDFNLEKDGFLVVKNELRAKALSAELENKIKDGKVRGTRAFTGEFYIIYSALLESSMEKVLAEMKKSRAATLASIAQNTKLTPTLARITLEFLKEEGQAMERKKDSFQYIE